MFWQIGNVMMMTCVHVCMTYALRPVMVFCVHRTAERCCTYILKCYVLMLLSQQIEI
jgi:hypothetical protein